MEIKPVRRTRAYEEIVSQIQGLMQQGELRPSDRLPPERELAERFRVSRVTVRQALSVLQAMGLIDSRVGDGTFARGDGNGATVTPLASMLNLRLASVREQLELRRLMEPQIARLAAERASGEDLAAMRRWLDLQQERCAAGLPFVDEDSAFHLAIARATKNALLIKMVEGIHELLRESRNQSLSSPEGMRRSLEGHRQIYKALCAGNGQAAYDAMLDHVLHIEGLTLKALAGSGTTS